MSRSCVYWFLLILCPTKYWGWSGTIRTRGPAVFSFGGGGWGESERENIRLISA